MRNIIEKQFRMAKYKLINQRGYTPNNYRLGDIYDSNETRLGGLIKGLIEDFPNDWELIKENNMSTEKQITLTLDIAKKIYGKNPYMDDLLLANFSKEELTKKELPKSWYELKIKSGYKLANNTTGGYVIKLPELLNSSYEQYSIFKTEKQVQSALAMAQLSQLMAVYNDGWEPNWGDTNYKWSLDRDRNKIVSILSSHEYKLLTFKEVEIRDEFLSNFEPLIKQYFMID